MIYRKQFSTCNKHEMQKGRILELEVSCHSRLDKDTRFCRIIYVLYEIKNKLTILHELLQSRQ